MTAGTCRNAGPVLQVAKCGRKEANVIYEPIMYEPIMYEPIFDNRFTIVVLFMNRFLHSPFVQEITHYEPIYEPFLKCTA